MIPGIWLGSKIKARQKSILKTMPDALDLLTISVEAGLGFDLALQRVADKWDNDLSREFQRVISDTRLGTTRREALRAMADRCGVERLAVHTSELQSRLYILCRPLVEKKKNPTILPPRQTH